MIRASQGSTRFAVRGNSRLAYDPGVNAQDGQLALVLLHDTLRDRRDFEAQRTSFGESMKVIVPDARGHGASATLANQWYSVAEAAQDIEAILDAEHVARAVLAGHGFGGAAALEFAIRRPDRTAALVLIEPSVWVALEWDHQRSSTELRDARRKSDGDAAEFAYKGVTDRALDLYFGSRISGDWKRDLLPARAAAIRRHAGALTGLLPALNGYSPDPGQLSALDVPVQIVIGQDALETERDVATALARRMPNARVHEIEIGRRMLDPFGGATGAQLDEILERAVAAAKLLDRDHGVQAYRTRRDA